MFLDFKERTICYLVILVSKLYSLLCTPGEGGLPLLPVSSGPCRPGRRRHPFWGDADSWYKRGKEAEVPAKPANSLQQQHPAGLTL